MTDNNKLYDAVIIGGGPAGLTAAIYLARARYRVLVIEKDRIGGQITITHEVVNYPGILNISGEELTNTMKIQAQNFGAEFLSSEVIDLNLNDDIKTITTKNDEIKAFSVLIATGANPRKVGFIGEDTFRGRGVAYCATCDGEFFTGKELLVIGGGFASAEESMFLTRYAKKVTILVRKDSFSCAKSIVEELVENPKIEVLYNTELKEITGYDEGIKKAILFNNKTKETHEFSVPNDTFGVFVFAGYVPNTNLIKDKVNLNESGYIITNDKHETNVLGVFAAGDVCIKDLRQVVTATADGALAASSMEKVCASLQEKLKIIPQNPNKTIKKTQTNSAPTSLAQTSNNEESLGFITNDMIPQLNAVFERMQTNLTLEVHTDNSPKSNELISVMNELSNLTPKLTTTQKTGGEHLPFVKLINPNTNTHVAFHGIPGGHEFTSFILGLYNVSGPGQPLEEAEINAAKSINKEFNLKLLVSLSCTMCPDFVVAAEHLAAINQNIKVEVYDLNLYQDLKDKYKVMSVPCLITNDTHVSFGRKNLIELIDYLNSLN
ncbi:MAG: FAD-dependent oxidoreductase [Succinivibrionaceae bacterium]|nr:FAD-dependent oxidoreductase [Ruminobacter sp.]MDY5779876.1 FAD-dependent oxidoreductase [Succinivibrionaceae bacterium]MEE1340941.1 FAD-dependent oxidoreductase [Succinivibrionaceae bacterium]